MSFLWVSIVFGSVLCCEQVEKVSVILSVRNSVQDTSEYRSAEQAPMAVL